MSRYPRPAPRPYEPCPIVGPANLLCDQPKGHRGNHSAHWTYGLDRSDLFARR